MNELIPARQVNSDKDHNESSQLAKKNEILRQSQRVDLDKLTKYINPIYNVNELDSSIERAHLNPIDHSHNKQFVKPTSQTNQPSYNFERKGPTSILDKYKVNGSDLSPIRRFQNEEQQQNQSRKSQQKTFQLKKIYQTSTPNILQRLDHQTRENSVSDYSSKYQSWGRIGFLERPQTERTNVNYFGSGNFIAGDSYKKQTAYSDHQTRPYTQREGANVTDLVSLNSSYKKVANFTINESKYEPFVRPYSTLNMVNRPQSYNFMESYRPTSYQQQNISNLKNFQSSRQNRINNLTALESEGIIDDDDRYMRTFMTDRPATRFHDQIQTISTYHPIANFSSIEYSSSQKNKFPQASMNQGILKEGKLTKSAISEIKRPHYENQYVEKRVMRKLGGNLQPKVIFKNNWCLLGLLFLFLIGFLAFGVWMARTQIVERHKYGAEAKQQQNTGVKPIYVDPTQIKHINETKVQNQTYLNESTSQKPIQFPPISQNITVITPQIQTRNDTKIAPSQVSTTKDIFEVSPITEEPVLAKEIPIVFPPVWSDEQTAKNESMVTALNGSMEVDNVIDKANLDVFEPVITPVTINTLIAAQTSVNATVLPQKVNDTEVTVIPSVIMPSQNITLKPSLPSVFQTNTQINVTVSVNIVPSNGSSTEIRNDSAVNAVNVSKPQFVDKKPEEQFIQPLQIQESENLVGYEAKGEFYFPVEKYQNYFIEPSQSIEIHPEVFPHEPITYFAPSLDFVAPSILTEKINDLSIQPIKQIQFNQTYSPLVQVFNQSISALIEPSFIASVNQITVLIPNIDQKVPTIEPLVLAQPTITPDIIPISLPSAQNKTFLSSQTLQTPSYINQYIQPLNLKEVDVSIPSIKEEIVQPSFNAPISQFGQKYSQIEPEITPIYAYITEPQQIKDISVPSIVEIQPPSLQTNYSVNPISTPIDMELINKPVEVVQGETIQPAIVQSIEIEPSVFNYLDVVQQKQPLNIEFVEPQSIDGQMSIEIYPEIQLPSTQVTPISIEPSIGQEQFEPQTSLNAFISPSQNFIDFTKDSTVEFQPEVAYNEFILPQISKNISSITKIDQTIEPIQASIAPQISVSPIYPIQLISPSVQPIIQQPAYVQPSKFVSPIPNVEIQPESAPSTSSPQFEPISISQKTIQPIKILPIQEVLPIQNLAEPQIAIQPISINTIDSEIPAKFFPQQGKIEVSPQVIPIEANKFEIEPITSMNSVLIQPETIDEGLPISPTEDSFILPSQLSPQNFIDASATSISSNTGDLSIQPTKSQPIVPEASETSKEPIRSTVDEFINPQEIDLPSVQPKTLIISQTNFTDPSEQSLFRIKRLNQIQERYAIYQIPTEFDKSKLPQIQKEFLAFYNKTLEQKSPFEIIPLSWTATKTLLTEKQYQIFYTHNKTANDPVSYIPAQYPVKISKNLYQKKESIIEVYPNGQIKILQKGQDWPEVEKMIQSYKDFGVPRMIPPNIKMQKTINHRHSLRRII